jgi:hypothetical protein
VKKAKAVENLPELRHAMANVVDNYLDVQQDILETLSTAVNCGNYPNRRYWRRESAFRAFG